VAKWRSGGCRPRQRRDFERRLATCQQDGNKDLLASVEKTLESAAGKRL